MFLTYWHWHYPYLSHLPIKQYLQSFFWARLHRTSTVLSYICSISVWLSAFLNILIIIKQKHFYCTVLWHIILLGAYYWGKKNNEKIIAPSPCIFQNTVIYMIEFNQIIFFTKYDIILRKNRKINLINHKNILTNNKVGQWRIRNHYNKAI